MSQAPHVADTAVPARSLSASLRAAGLRVTSARLLTLRMAPAVLAEHGRLNPKLMHSAACRQGDAHISMSAFYGTLPTLAAAGLLPAHAIWPNARAAGASAPIPSNETKSTP